MRPYQDDGTADVSSKDLTWDIDTASALPPSAQLVERALDAIARGALVPGTRLPSVRGLAAEARVNPNTAARAWRDLEQLGAARGENGRGVFVTEEAPELARRLRGAATLDALERALDAALRAGHDPDHLRDRLRDRLDLGTAPVPAPLPRDPGRQAG